MAIYALSDIHGHGRLLGEVFKFLKEDDTLYFLGDACDRGYENINCIKKLLTDPRVIYLKGNHEDMLVRGYKSGNFSLVFYNGGRDTVNSLLEMSKDEQKKFIEKLDKLPKEAEYINERGLRIVMNHSGYDATNPVFQWDNLDPILWDRQQIGYPWKGDDKTIFVHGHTPVQLLSTVDRSISLLPICYCGGHKINIDMGAFHSNKTCLLNLNDFSAFLFDRTIKKVEVFKTEITQWT